MGFVSLYHIFSFWFSLRLYGHQIDIYFSNLFKYRSDNQGITTFQPPNTGNFDSIADLFWPTGSDFNALANDYLPNLNYQHPGTNIFSQTGVDPMEINFDPLLMKEIADAYSSFQPNALGTYCPRETHN